MLDFVRVAQVIDGKRRELSIARSSYESDPGDYTLLDKPGLANDGTVLPPKFTPESLGDGPSAAPPTGVTSYDDMHVDDLRAEIDSRNASRPEDEPISKSGNKKALVEALAADDAKVGEAPPTDESLSS